MAVKRLSVVVPVHNEQANIRTFAERLQKVALGLSDWSVELLFVDDGSTDGTAAAVMELRERGLPAGLLRLSRNFGHQAALEAGLRNVTADAVITMDGDLQHPPEELPRMLTEVERGADVVQMVRDGSAAGGKGLLSKLFYKVFASVAKSPIVPDAADFRLLSRRVVEVIRGIPEREKFLRGLVPSLGFTQVVLSFREMERSGGRPSYGFMQSVRLARKALLDFSTLPLRLVFWLGFVIAIGSFATGIGHIVVKLIKGSQITPGFTDIIVAILFLSGCILAALGVLGYYLVMILEQLRNRPVFVVMEHLPGGEIRGTGAKGG